MFVALKMCDRSNYDQTSDDDDTDDALCGGGGVGGWERAGNKGSPPFPACKHTWSAAEAQTHSHQGSAEGCTEASGHLRIVDIPSPGLGPTVYSAVSDLLLDSIA